MIRLLDIKSAFTVAHSITLGLATFGTLNVRAGPVEVAIALSIVLLSAQAISRLWISSQHWRKAIPAYAMGCLAFYWFTERALGLA